MLRSLLALLALAPAAVAQKEFGFDNKKASGQPYRTPAETVAGMTVPPEFEVKLFAGEPQVVNPVAFSIDERGRVWVLECFEYPSKTPKGKAPRDRIIILEDTDGDGVADKRTVFAEGKDFPVPPERATKGLPAFDIATGLEVGHGAVWVGAPPYLWKVDIGPGDKPAKFEPVLGGFGSQDTHETLNTFTWGPDGWLYGMQGVFTQSAVKAGDGAETKMNAAVWRLHPVTRKFEIYAEGTSNPWGLDWRTADGQFIMACCVIPHLYHVVPGGIYKRQAGGSYNPHAYEFIQEISDHTFHRESGWAHAGLISLDVPHMPARFRDSVIFGSIHGCSLKQNILKPHGSSYTASRGDDFLTSADKNMRPINLKWGPHGDIYLIDWHDQNPCHQAPADAWDYERGRVYRIQLKGTPARAATFDLAGWADGELAALATQTVAGGGMQGGPGAALAADGNTAYRRLAGVVGEDRALRPSPYWPRTARRLLAGRAGRLAPAVRAALALAPSAAYGTGDEEAVFAAVHETHAHEDWMAKSRPGTPREYAAQPRAALVRTVADGGGLSEAGLTRLTELAAGERYAPVRRELAAAAVRLADKHDVSALVHALMAHKEDAADPLIPHLTWLAYEKVLSKPVSDGTAADAELGWLAEHAAGNPFVADRIVPKVMRRLVAAGALDRCLRFAADLPDAARRQALGGLAVALGDKTLSPPASWAALRDKFPGDPLLDPLAVSFRDPAAVEQAERVFRDFRNATPEARAEAVRRLVRLQGNDARDLLLTVINREGNERVRVEAARQVSNLSGADVAADVLTVWAKAAPPLPRPVRAELVTALAGRKEWAKALLGAVKAGVVDRGELSDTHVTRMQALKDKEVDALIGTAWGRTRPTPAELDAAINQMRDALHAGPGSFGKGKAVFAAQCGKCHQFDGAGANVGPALDGAGRDIEYLLANVIDPNRVVGAPYFQRIVTLQDGRVEQGLLHAEDDKGITLKGENGVLKQFARDDLDGPVKVVERSLMPEGLAAAMGPQDFRDLVVYLMASPFPAAAAVADKPVTVPVGGLIPLPPGDGKPVTVTLRVTASGPLATKLLVGSADPYTVAVDGVPAGEGKGGRGPDAETFPVTLSPGEHAVTLTVKWRGTTKGVYARLLDPDRKLTAGR